MSSVVDARESECDEADAEAWEPNDPAFGRISEKVWVISGSPSYVTETIVDALRKEEAPASWCCLPRRNDVPNHL